MTFALPIVWSDRHRLHEPGGEIWIGVRTPGTDVPRRAEAIRDALPARGATFVAAEPVSEGGYREARRSVGAMDLATVVVQEGGCDLTTTGALVAEMPAGVQQGATRA